MLLTDILTEQLTYTLVEAHPFLGKYCHFYMSLFHIEYPFDDPNIGNIVIDFLRDPAMLNKALILASIFGGIWDVKLFLKLGADVNAKDEYDDNALEGALVAKKLEIIKLLVDAGSKLSEDYYEAAKYLGEEYTKPLRIAYERTLNSN